MNTELSPSPAWGQLHAALLQQRSHVQSAEIIQRVNRALLAGEVVNAAFYDLSLLKLLQQRKTQPLLTPDARREIEDFIAALNPLLPDKLSDVVQFDKLQRRVTRLVQRFPWQYASPPLVQSYLFMRTYLRWQKTLELLFKRDAQHETFSALKRVLKTSSARLALLGDAPELYLMLAELLALCRQKAAESAQQDALSHYIAAADIAAHGIITLAVTAEGLLRQQALPSSEAVSRRIQQHRDSVIERTHPWFYAV